MILLRVTVLLLTILANSSLARGKSSSLEIEQTLQPGYPGWKQPKFKMAPSLAKGRFLYYRKSPEVERLRSAVHELYMRPYNYAHVDHHAVAVVQNEKVSGIIHFYQLGGPTSPVSVTGNITGLSPGLHGFHVHQFGDTSNGCKSMAGHFNPFHLRHGSPYSTYRHVGDLGNIEADSSGVAFIDIQDTHISLNGLNSIIGRGLVVHMGEDDLGMGGDDGSLLTGNAGGRLACAVIAVASDSV